MIMQTDNLNRKAKADAGKPRLSLVPSEIIRDIARVREYGNDKYGDPENWKTVEPERYRDAAYRNMLMILPVLMRKVDCRNCGIWPVT